jgi:hypothetical protein
MSQRLGKWYSSDLNGGPHYCESKVKEKKQQPADHKENRGSKSSQVEKQPQLKDILEAQVLLEGMDARLKRVKEMLFIEGATTTEQHTVT